MFTATGANPHKRSGSNGSLELAKNKHAHVRRSPKAAPARSPASVQAPQQIAGPPTVLRKRAREIGSALVATLGVLGLFLQDLPLPSRIAAVTATTLAIAAIYTHGKWRVLMVALTVGLVCFFAAFFWAQRPLYETDFVDDGDTWAVRSDETGDSRYTGEGYEVTPNPGYAVWRSAPTPARPAAVVVSATAQLNGSGGWGIWCRGTPDGQRYEFSLTHAGKAYIKTRAGESATINSANVNPNRPTILQARCEDLPDQVVHLTMWVNGVIVAEEYDNSPGLLGPGSTGVHAFGFGDLSAERPQALFQHFMVQDGSTVD